MPQTKSGNYKDTEAKFYVTDNTLIIYKKSKDRESGVA